MTLRNSSSSLSAKKALERIDLRDGEVRAWVHVDREKVIEEANAIDRRLSGAPLYGLTLGVKDIIDVVGMPTRCGSPVSDDRPKSQDAAIVTYLRECGALVIGKTVTTEFAFMTPGVTRNPHNLERSPGGSSSGSAAAVADGHIDVALGTQTAGSIIRPAAFCGVVGYKPTYNFFSFSGIKSISPSLDTVGWMARDVTMVLKVYDALVPQDRRQEVSARFSLVRGPDWDAAEPEARLTVENAARIAAADEGAPDLSNLNAVQVAVMRFEMRRELATEYQAAREKLSPGLRDLFESPVGLGDYVRAREDRRTISYDAIFGDADILLMLPAPGEAVPLATTGDPIFNRIPTLLGTPCITLPAGRSNNGLPLGVQLIARPFMDLQLLQAARALERMIGA